MTVLGVGLDIVDVLSFAGQLDDPASGFADATFTRAERADAAQAPVTTSVAARLAGRFAAKEAFVKAWSAARRGRPPALATLDLRDIEVVADAWGRPALRLHGEVAGAWRSLPAGADLDGQAAIHLSISHDGPTASAVVVLDVP